MFQIQSWPHVIAHIDGDAFFASVTQAEHPSLKGKPLVTGSERGIATAVSYEARALGITRGLPIFKIKQQFPSCIILESDYRLYSVYATEMFKILREFSPWVEEYSIDEAFVDLKGMRYAFRTGYGEIALQAKDKIEEKLGISITDGVSLNKSLAKLASSLNRPSGFNVFSGKHIESLLIQVPIEKVWGIGSQTSAYLKKHNIYTAHYAIKSSEQFIAYLAKPYKEIWRELRGEKVFDLDTDPKNTYKSMLSSRTFSKPTNKKEFLWSRILAHAEYVFLRARKFGYSVGKIHIFLKNQRFKYFTYQVVPFEKITYPIEARDELRKGFEAIYKKEDLYRTAGCTVSDLVQVKNSQIPLFKNTNPVREKLKKIYPLYENRKINFGGSLFEA